MTHVNMNLRQFQKRFCSEEACLQAIFAARWPRGFVCPYCEHNGGTRITTRRSMQCSLCRRQTSITAGTVFEGSKTLLMIWFLIIYFVAHDKGGASATRLAKQLGVSRGTVWSILQRVRMAMASREENLTLAGYIEMDEAFFGGRSKSKQMRKPRSANKKQVLVLVESEGCQAGNLVMKVIESSQYKDLEPILRDKIESEPAGQWFRSDGLGSHHVVIALGHRINMAPVASALLDQELRCVSLSISHAKRFFKGTYHHFCKMHIQRYLDEFCYRWNRRHLERQLASHLIAACSLHPPIRYIQIPASKPPEYQLPEAA